MQELIKKLDLNAYLESFTNLFARQKDLILAGDINIHYELIKNLAKVDFNPPLKVANLDRSLIHLQKMGILSLEENYEFIKIIKYFKYLKKLNFEDKLKNFVEKIIIPKEIEEFLAYFDKKGELNSGVNEDYDKYIIAIKSSKEKIRQDLSNTLTNGKLKLYLVDSQIHLVNDEQCLLLRAGFSAVLKGSIIQRSSAGFFYVLPKNTSHEKEKLSSLKLKIQDKIFEISKNISLCFSRNLMFLKFINKEFDKFDHYQARVFFAKIEDKNFILAKKTSNAKLIDFFHPALSKPKPISIDFSKSIILITGVNAGGKTMMLKSILSACFLSKYLIPYRANPQSIIPQFKEIVSILDDPQSVKNDISTFAGRMLEFSKLFTKRNVLVGVDELELGTDSDEAASLFKVILEELIQKDIKIILTTHHKRLAALMASNEKVELIAALYDEVLQRPRYEFLQGTIGRSYAFETALRYNIPFKIIENARKVYGEDKDKLNDLIQRSSQLELEFRQKIQILDKKIEDNDKKEQTLKNEREKLDDFINAKRDELHKDYTDARDEAKLATKAKLAKEGHQHLNISHAKVKKIKVEKVSKLEDFKIGDRVKYQNLKGQIVSIKAKYAFIENDLGIKLKISLEELKRSAKIPSKKAKISINIQKSQDGDIKLDLHGQRVEEALENLDKFISDALLANFDEVLVYHGIGTGKLAFSVKKFLQTHPSVKSFSDAHPSSGGFGAKVVKL